MPGLLLSDSYDLALIQTLPREQAVAVSDAVGANWGMVVLYLPAIFATSAFWRAGRVPVWVPAFVVAASVVGLVELDGLLGALVSFGLMTASFAFLGVRLLREPRHTVAADNDREVAPT